MTATDDRSQRIKTGRWGETAALAYLEGHGYELLERNFRSPDGEIDLVMLKNGELVFVEVKTRRSRDFGTPEEAVDDEKLEHLEASAGWYLLEHAEFAENWRLDVIAVIGSPGIDCPEIEWFVNVNGD